MAKNAKEYLPVVVPIANRYVDCIAGHLNEHNRLDDESTSFRILTGMFALEAAIKVVVGVDFPVLTVPLAQQGEHAGSGQSPPQPLQGGTAEAH